MPNKPRQRRRAPDEADLETNIPPDALRDDVRRSMPPRDDQRPGEVPMGGGFTPTPDGRNEHPIHDEDQEDATPEDYEREIDRLDGALRPR